MCSAMLVQLAYDDIEQARARKMLGKASMKRFGRNVANGGHHEQCSRGFVSLIAVDPKLVAAARNKDSVHQRRALRFSVRKARQRRLSEAPRAMTASGDSFERF
eukprot:4883606-Pleurochrysis_carterae.AAC.2